MNLSLEEWNASGFDAGVRWKIPKMAASFHKR